MPARHLGHSVSCREGIDPMMDALRGAPAADAPPRARLARFALVGMSGVLVNLAALHALAAGLGIPEVAASALAIEASVLSNFALNDRFTFRDRRGAAGAAARLLRYHLVCAVGIGVQLGAFAALALAARHLLGRPALGGWRYLAQLAGIGLAFAWNFHGSARFAWEPVEQAAPVTAAAEPRRAVSRPPRSVRGILRAPWAGRGREGATDPGAGAGRWVPELLLAALIILHVLPIWLVPRVPTQDGPLHVENVLALLGHAGGSPLLQRWYDANWGAQPNWLTQALLAPLLQLASPATAEKLVLTGYTVLLPLAFRAVLPRGARGAWGTLLVFPLVQAFPYQMGFWNFCWGLALALLWAAAWTRARGRVGPLRVAGLAVLALLLYLAHPMALGAALLAAGAVLGVRAVRAVRRAAGREDRRRRVLRAYLARAGGMVATAGPGLLLLAAWMLRHRDHASARLPLPELLAKLATAYSLVAIDRQEVPLAAAVALVLFVGVVHRILARAGRGLRVRSNDGWLVAAALFTALAVAVPDVTAAGANVSDRLELIALLSIAAWIGTDLGSLAALRRTALALAALAVVALGVRFQKQRQLAALVDEYVSAGRVVGHDRVILPLVLSPWGPRDARGHRLGYRVKALLHAGSWIVAEQGGVELKNSQANTDHCPVRWPAGRNPFRVIASSLRRMEGVPPCVDLRAADRMGGLDYVLVWGASRALLDTPCGAALAADLAAGFEPVYLSQPRGMLEIWRPRPATARR